jgi:hypothetical protein
MLGFSVLLVSLEGFRSAPLTSAPCAPLSAAQPIPDDGRWLRVCLFTPPVPEGAIVARVHVKYSIDHPDPDSLEIFLSRDPEGLRQPLWEHGRSPQGATFGRAPGLTAFAGTPASEIWYLWIRDTVPGGSGWLRSAGVVVDYAPIPVPDAYRGPPPVPAFRLPEGIPPSSPTPDRDPPNPRRGRSTRPLRGAGRRSRARPSRGFSRTPDGTYGMGIPAMAWSISGTTMIAARTGGAGPPGRRTGASTATIPA